jgi:tRNA-modifying protein YgfZ
MSMTTGYQALRTGVAVLDLVDRGAIVARGRDRARLLHNITTNEVKKMSPGQGAYAFLLNPQGRIQADLNLFCFAEHFLIDTEPELGEKVRLHIRKYIIADQVELEDASAATAAIGLEGPAAAAVLASLGAPAPGSDYAHAAWGDVSVAALSATGQPGFRLFAPAAAKDDLLRQLQAAGAVPATADDARTVRIENGRPRYGEDILETSLPQETQQMHAVSFSKGCYLGQEIVERIRARGHVNRKLVRLEIAAAVAPPSGSKLLAGDAEAGEITSAVYSEQAGRVAALAYVRVPHNEPGMQLKAGDADAVIY